MALFQNQLGYAYYGDWQDRADNSNIEEEYLRHWLQRQGVDEGIQQNLDNQKKVFIRNFFTTIQLVMAGNDSQGLRYGTIETPAKHYYHWKEENPAYTPIWTSSRGNTSPLTMWRRNELKQHAAELLHKWQPIIGKQVALCGIKKMRTRWGSCNSEKRNIWLNLELSKKPPKCLECILVHEMVHMLKRGHNDTFRRYMDEFMPNWRLAKAQLNQLPLKHENWQY